MTDSDLIERLRGAAKEPPPYGGRTVEGRLEWQAADRLAALEVENNRLRKALEPFAAVSIADNIGGTVSIMPRFLFNPPGELGSLNSDSFRCARSALSQERGE